MAEPSKFELVSYLSDLLSIMESRDQAGGINRGPALGREYERVYAQYRAILDKEEKDLETRKRQDNPRSEDRAAADGDQPRSSGAVGERSRQPLGFGTDAPGPRVQGPEPYRDPNSSLR